MAIEEGNGSFEEKGTDLEEAINLTGFGRYHVGLVLICGMCLTTMINESMGVSFVLPAAQCDLQLTTFDKGLLSGATFLGMILSAHGWGFCADTMGRKQVLLTSLSGTWVSSFCSSFAPTVWAFILLRFLTGFFICGMSSTVYAYLSEFLPAKNRSTIMTWTCIFIAFAFLTIPGGAWVLLPLDVAWDLGFVVFKSWRLFIMLMGSTSLIAFVLFLQYPESPKFLMSVEKKEEALQVLRMMYATNTGKNEDDYPVKDLKFESITTSIDSDVGPTSGCISPLQFARIMWRQTAPLFVRPHGWTTLLFCTLQFGIYVSAGGMYLWVPNILNNLANFVQSNPNINGSATVCEAISSHQEAEKASVIASECNDTIGSVVYITTLTIGACYVVSYTTIGALISFFNKRTVLVTAQILSGMAGIGVLFAKGETLVTAFLSAYVVLAGTCISVLSAAVVDLYPTNLRAMAVSLALTSGRLGSGLAGNIIGILIESNCAVAFTGLAFVTLGCGLLCLLIPQPKSSKPIVK